MQKQNLDVNAITFTDVVSAGTHVGPIDKVQYYFNVMINDHQIKPTKKHYCNIELGKLDVQYWEKFYLWGRLQKSVHIVVDTLDVNNIKSVNLRVVVSTTLVLLPSQFTEINNMYEERRLVVGQSCGELAKFVWPDIRDSYSIITSHKNYLSNNKIDVGSPK
ncbi:hypothetical protein JHK82_050902 [Glycine max]|nr:hypothetical protein JHK86_050757 [Glycine max]KAG4936680.1 hypothetical protein JHK85_051599 [Glycine max]KAG5092124.1 hypothetical protein JHK82_050902 [Glycine max]